MSEFWVSTPKKQCEYCKCWIADNRASIDFHERGKNHQENVKKKLADVRKNAALKRKQDDSFKSEFAKMEENALKAMKKDMAENSDFVGLSDMKALTTKPPPAADVAPPPSKKEAKTAMGSSSECAWEKHTAVQGHSYYYNKNTGESTWKKPKDYLSSKNTKAQAASNESEAAKPAPRNPHTHLGSWTVVESETAPSVKAIETECKTVSSNSSPSEQDPSHGRKFKEKTLSHSTEDDDASDAQKVAFRKPSSKNRRVRPRGS